MFDIFKGMKPTSESIAKKIAFLTKKEPEIQAMIDIAIKEETELRQQKILGEPIDAAVLKSVSEQTLAAEADLRAVKVVRAELHKKLRETIAAEHEEEVNRAKEKIQALDVKRCEFDMLKILAEFAARYERLKGLLPELGFMQWPTASKTRTEFDEMVTDIKIVLEKKEGPGLSLLRSRAETLESTYMFSVEGKVTELLTKAGVIVLPETEVK